MPVQSAAEQFRLTLYIAGRAMLSLHAINNLQRICEEQIPGQYELTIIDTLEDPAVLERENIIFTPVTIRELPLPRKRVLGDLTKVENVIKLFDLSP